ARDLAAAITRQLGQNPQRKESASDSIKSLVEKLPNDGALVSHYAKALAHEGKRKEAAAQVERARKLGANLTAVLDPNLVRDLDREAGRGAPAPSRPAPAHADPVAVTFGGIVGFLIT